MQYLAARLGRPWQDWGLYSAHAGDCDAVTAVMQGKPAFFLTGGERTPAWLCERWAALRGTLFTEDHLNALFADYLAQIPALLREAEAERWPQEAVVYSNLLNNFTSFIRQRLTALDRWYKYAP